MTTSIKTCLGLLCAPLLCSAFRVNNKASHSDMKATAGACTDFLGAEIRESTPYPQCKCDHDQTVYCGYSNVGLRKFDANAVKNHPECKDEVPYCAEKKERPPLKTILRQDECRSWNLFSITNMVATPTWFTSNSVMRATAVVTPGELKYKGKEVAGKNSGNPELHFLVPADALAVKVKVSPDDFVIQFDLQQMKNGPKTLQDRGGGGVTAELITGERVQQKLQDLNDALIYIKDPYHYMFDEPEVFSNKTKAFTFYKKWLAYRNSGFGDEPIPSTGMWQKLDNGCFDNCRLAPIGPNETKVIGYEYAVSAMKEMGPKLQCNNLFRRNEFGVNVLNGWWWPEKTNHAIGLADSLIDHALNRKWIDRLIGPTMANKQETIDFFRTTATKYWTVSAAEKMSAEVLRPTEQKFWTTQVLHKLLVDVTISDEDATTFLMHKENVVVAMMLPEWIGGWHGGGDDALQWKKEAAVKYKKSLGERFGEDFTSMPDVSQSKLVAGIMDALMFAGGVSVPTVIKSCFSILYGKYGQAQMAKQFGHAWHLDESKLESFVHETIRRFPAVGGFLAWDRYTGSKTNVDLRGSNADRSEAGWGAHARDFWMRDVAEYDQKSISWGDFAMVNGDNAHPGSRACPAKRASFLMIREFMRAFLQSGGVKCWKPKDQSKVIMAGQGGAEFELVFQKDVCIGQ